MKKSEEYYSNNLYDLTSAEKKEVVMLIKQAQIDAIEEACKRCAKEAMKIQKPTNWKYVSKKDLMLVADKMKEELNEPIV